MKAQGGRSGFPFSANGVAYVRLSHDHVRFRFALHLHYRYIAISAVLISDQSHMGLS